MDEQFAFGELNTFMAAMRVGDGNNFQWQNFFKSACLLPLK
jgi:hypothetical protein